MRILGIDPGLRTTGFGVIEAEGSRLAYVASGTIRTDALPVSYTHLTLPTILLV